MKGYCLVCAFNQPADFEGRCWRHWVMLNCTITRPSGAARAIASAIEKHPEVRAAAVAGEWDLALELASA
jgi:hypothetical protein